MRYIAGAAIAGFVALVQASSVEQFHVLGVVPNLMLAFLVSWLVVRGLDDVLPMVAVAGLTIGFVGLQTPGLVLLAMLLAVCGVGVVRELHVVHSEAVLALASVLAASLVYETVLLLSVMATGGALDLRSGLGDVVLPAALVNLAITPPIYLVMRLARPSRAPRLGYA